MLKSLLKNRAVTSSLSAFSTTAASSSKYLTSLYSTEVKSSCGGKYTDKNYLQNTEIHENGNH